MKALILVTGSDGLVGSRFVELTERRNYLHLPTEIEFDITDFSEVRKIIGGYLFSAVINFAGFTDIEKAEEQRNDKSGDCWQVNFEGVKNLVEAIKSYKARIHFIQISTDDVFSGDSEDPGPYSEYHQQETNLEKLTSYGYSKAQAEKYILSELGGYATILRINYPVRAKFSKKLDLLRKHLKLFDEGKLYPLFNDQHISISFIDELSRVIDRIILGRNVGIFHAASCDCVNPYDLITYLVEKARGKTDQVKSTSIDEFLKTSGNPTFRYPKYGGLKVEQTDKELGFKFKSWREIVDQIVLQGIEY